MRWLLCLLVALAAPRIGEATAFDGAWGIVVSPAVGPPIRCVFTLSSVSGVSLSASCDDGTVFSAFGYPFPDADSFVTELVTPVNGIYFVSGSSTGRGTSLAGVIGLLGGFELPFSGSRCGNGLLDDGEGCDGGLAGDACCSACQPITDGGACERDGDACTRDTCVGGSCVTSACSPCCESGLDCAAPAAISCIGSTTRATRIDLRTAPAGKEQLTWKASRLVTVAGDVGDPTSSGDYALCVFAGSPRRLLLDATLPAASQCGSKPCWLRTTSGVKYRNPARTPDGIDRTVVRIGATGSVTVKGKGPGLLTHTPLLIPLGSFPPPVAILLKSPTACWATDFGAAGTVVRYNALGRFTAKLGQ